MRIFRHFHEGLPNYRAILCWRLFYVTLWSNQFCGLLSRYTWDTSHGITSLQKCALLIFSYFFSNATGDERWKYCPTPPPTQTKQHATRETAQVLIIKCRQPVPTDKAVRCPWTTMGTIFDSTPCHVQLNQCWPTLGTSNAEICTYNSGESIFRTLSTGKLNTIIQWDCVDQLFC